uniref:Uncharacterized protein n=1 Tax=Bactrocera dorsalis TaxID=27457 RepID=A0A034VG31_BACDO
MHVCAPATKYTLHFSLHLHFHEFPFAAKILQRHAVRFRMVQPSSVLRGWSNVKERKLKCNKTVKVIVNYNFMKNRSSTQRLVAFASTCPHTYVCTYQFEFPYTNRKGQTREKAASRAKQEALRTRAAK